MKKTSERFKRGKQFGEQLVKYISIDASKFASNAYAINYYKNKARFVKETGKDYHDWYEGIISVLEKTELLTKEKNIV